MSKIDINDDEKQMTNQWLTKAQRFLAFSRGQSDSCKRRACIDAGMCMAQTPSSKSDKSACGAPLEEGDVALTVKLALFGMMLEEGLLQSESETDR